MKKRHWDKPKLLVLVRPESADNVTVLQVCKFTGLAGPIEVDCLSGPGPLSAACLGIVAS